MSGDGPNEGDERSLGNAANLSVSRTKRAGVAMVIKRELARQGDRFLIEVQFVGVSGQVCSLRYELDGPEKLYFNSREEAEAALRAS
jgi:hypothetical protein